MVVRRKKRNPIKAMIITTAILLVIASMALFVLGGGEISLNGFFDRIINGPEETDEIPTNVDVSIYNTNDPVSFKITDELENVINNYFKLYYSALGELGNNQLPMLYSNTSAANAYDNAILSYLIDMRKNSLAPLTYSACNVTITYINANLADGKIAEITLKESFDVVFDCAGMVSSSVLEREHFFAFYYVDKIGWQIERHEDRSIFGKYIAGLFENILVAYNQTRETVTLSYIDHYLTELVSSLYTVPTAALSETVITSEPEPEYPYNRNDAAVYAVKWADKAHNQDKFCSYDDNGMNFVSQCVFAGGIPMDAHGEGYQQWKWYSDELNHGQQSGERTGYSRAWINGDAFYRYITENVGFGMVTGIVPLEKAEKGDVIQLLNKSDQTVKMQGIVTGIVQNEIFLCTNSEDMQNIPLSTLGYDNVRVIKIYGYNT